MRQNIKKRILSLIMIFTITFVASVPAYAEWKQNSNQYWNYINPDGTLKKEWLKESGNWYYLDPDGNMVVGWMPYNGTWYYFQNNGVWDSSKTLTSIPRELTLANNKVEQYSKDKVSYLNSVVYGDKQFYRFMPEGEWKYGTPTYYYSPSTGEVFELTEGILVRLDVNKLMNGKYTFDQCKDISDEAFKNELGSTYFISSDGTVNKWGEYYFIAYSTNTNQKMDAFYVSAINEAIRR